MRIAISGTAGSGKSTIAKLLAKKLHYKHYSMGDFQREIAKEKGVSIVELGELEKKDPAIDRMVDDRQRLLGEKKDDLVIDSWLSAFFIPNSYRIFMDAGIEERAKRVFGREKGAYKDIKDAASKIKQREKTNRERWKKFYGFDFMDKRNYDLVINTSGKTIDEIAKKIYTKIKKN